MSLRSSPLITAAALSRSIAAFAFALLAASVLGPVSFGYFSVVWAFATAALVFVAGFNTALIARLVHLRTDAGNDARRLANGAGALILAGALLAAVVGCSFWQASRWQGLPPELFLGAGLMLSLQMLSSYACAVLEGFGRLRPAVLLPLLGVSLNALGLLAVKLAGLSPSLPQFLWLCVSGFAAESAVALAVALRSGTLRPALGASWSGLNRLVTGGAALQASALVAFFLDPLSKTALLGWLGPAAVALFDLAMKIGWGLHTAFTAYSRLFLQIAADDHAARVASFETAAAQVWATSLLVAALVLLWGTPLLVQVTASTSAQAANMLVLALLATLLMVWAAPAYVTLIALGAHGFVLRNQMLLAGGNAVGAFMLVPLLGATGVLWGLIAASLLNAVLLWRQIPRRIVDFPGFAQLCSQRGVRLAVASVLLAAGWGAHQIGAQSPWTLLLLSAPVLVQLLREPPVLYVANRMRGGRA